GRGRVVRQLLTESTLLAGIGGLDGLALAFWGVAAVRALAPAGLPRIATVGVSAPATLFNFGIALFAGLVCGLAPAFRSHRSDCTKRSRPTRAARKIDPVRAHVAC